MAERLPIYDIEEQLVTGDITLPPRDQDAAAQIYDRRALHCLAVGGGLLPLPPPAGWVGLRAPVRSSLRAGGDAMSATRPCSANGLHISSRKTAACEKQQKPPANKGHFPIHLGPLPDHCRTASQATPQPRHCPRAWEGGVAMKVKGFGKGRATIAWFTSFSGETVQAMVEPLFRSTPRIVGYRSAWLPIGCAETFVMWLPDYYKQAAGDTLAHRPSNACGSLRSLAGYSP